MESTQNDKPNQSTFPGGQNPIPQEVSAVQKAADATRHAAARTTDAAGEKLGQAKQKLGEKYDQINRSVNGQFDKASVYSRNNTGKATLIALGAGVGIGLLIGGNIRGSRRIRGRIVEPVIDALTTVAKNLFA